MKSVAIIGAGVSGLCSLKHALEADNLEPVIFEMSQSIGGTWVYDKKWADLNNWADVYSSMYQNLITNQPRQIMELPDLKFKEGLPAYLTHEMVLSYLKRYCAKFDLMNHIKLGHKVLHVLPVHPKQENSEEVRWRVDVVNLQNNQIQSSVFDAVIVANGHYAKPNLPKLPGIDKFKGKILHSHSYRKPHFYMNQNVLIVGAGPSGLDIALDVAVFAERVFVSHRDELLTTTLPPNVTQVPGVNHLNGDGCSVTLSNGKVLNITTIIFCTGYLHSFSFLDKRSGIAMENDRITPIFKHIVNITHNNMLFVGVPDVRAPIFRLLNLQSIYVIGVLAGIIKLPSKQEMILDETNEHNLRLSRGWPSKAHVIAEWNYPDYLCEVAGVKCIPDNIKNLYDFIIAHRLENLCNFKKQDYVLNEENEYVAVCSD